MKYDTPVYYQIKKCIMVRNVCKILKKLIKHHDFSRRGNIESHKTESGFNNQVVVANVLNMYVKNVNKQ